MLIIKMLRDMKLHKMQFISIFLMSFLGVFIFTGIGGEWAGLQKNVNDYYKETNFADVWLYGKGFSKQDENAVKKIDKIKESERRLTLSTVGQFKNSPKIELNFIEKNQISKSYRVRGEKFSLKKDGIWLDDRFSKSKKLNIGDYITVSYNGMQIRKKILGTIYSPEYVYASSDDDLIPNFSNFGYAYLSYKAFPKNLPITYTKILIITTSTNMRRLEDNVNKTLKGNYSVFMSRDNNGSYGMFRDEIAQHKSMGSIFPVAFLAIAMLTILTTMTRIVNNQRSQIGTLKAMGFKNRKILWHYVSYGFWLSLVGSFIGAAIGPVTLPKLFYPSMSATYTLPQWKPSILPIFYVMAALSVAACTIVTYLSCKNVLNVTPAQALRPKAPKSIKHGILERTALWKKLGFTSQWNIRDIRRSKLRSIMAIIGVLSCTMLLVCAFGMKDCIYDFMRWQYYDLDRFSTKLNISKKASNDQINSIIKKINGQSIMEGTIEIKAKEIKKSAILTVNDNVTLVKATDLSRNFISLPENGIAMSYKMSEILNVKKGDRIKWHIYGEEKWINSRIDKIYRTPSSQGITLNRKLFEKLGEKYSPTSIITLKNVTKKYRGISAIWSKDQLTKSWNDMTETMNTMVIILISAAILLAVVVLYNLGLLSFTEMERELATLKVVGFKSKKIRNILLTQNVWLSVVGVIIGIPCGKLLIDVMVGSMGDTFDMMTIITVKNVLLSTAITMLLSIIVTYMFSKKIRNIDMVSSLKGVE